MAASTVVQYPNGKLAYGIGSNQTTTSVGSFQGWVVSGTTSREGEVKTYKDNTGVTQTMVIPEQWQQVQFEILLFGSSSGKQLPKKGDVISGVPSDIFSKELQNLRLESISVQWANEDVAKCSVTAREYSF